MRKLLFAFALNLFVFAVYAQKTNHFKVGLEFGQGSIEGDYSDKWNIRQDIDIYLYDYSPFNSRLAYAQSDFFYLGIKPQVSLWNNRINLYSGIRFTMLNGSIGDKKDRHFFYFRTTNPDAVEFYKIFSINEKNGYLSIPLEMSYNIFHSNILTPDITVSFYGKAGVEAGLMILNKRHVDFVSEAMRLHENEVLGSVEKPGKPYGTFYGAIGAQLTLRNGMQLNMEGIIPSKIVTKNHNSIIQPDYFSGVQLSVQLPFTLFTKTR